MSAYLMLLHRVETVERILRRTPVIQDRNKPFEKYDDAGFMFRFHLPKHVVLEILDLIEARLQPTQTKVASVPPVMQLLITLQFYSS